MKNNKLKTFLFLLIALCVVVFPVKAEELLTTSVKEEVVEEAYFNADDNLDITKKIAGSSFVAGNNVTVNGEVDGIQFIAGNNIIHKGNASYALIAGNTIEILGNYEKDVAIAGNIIKVRNEAVFGRDVAIFGNEVTISGVVNRDIAIYAENVYFENAKILGGAEILAQNISFSEDSKIEGNLKTNLDQNVEAKYVGGSIKHIETEEYDIKYEFTIKDIIIAKITSLVSTLLTFVVLFLIFPKVFNKVSEANFDFMQIISLCGSGLIFLVFLPFVAILLMITIIGFPLALLSIAFYVISICLANMFTGYYLGEYIWKSLLKKDDNPLVHTLIGITIIFILSLIPVVKIITSILSLIIGLGLIIFVIIKKR